MKKILFRIKKCYLNSFPEEPSFIFITMPLCNQFDSYLIKMLSRLLTHLLLEYDINQTETVNIGVAKISFTILTAYDISLHSENVLRIYLMCWEHFYNAFPQYNILQIFSEDTRAALGLSEMNYAITSWLSVSLRFRFIWFIIKW